MSGLGICKLWNTLRFLSMTDMSVYVIKALPIKDFKRTLNFMGTTTATGMDILLTEIITRFKN